MKISSDEMTRYRILVVNVKLKEDNPKISSSLLVSISGSILLKCFTPQAVPKYTMCMLQTLYSSTALYAGGGSQGGGGCVRYCMYVYVPRFRYSIYNTAIHTHTNITACLKVPKREIFDRSDFPNFCTIKSSWEVIWW